jgi:hypothetical protein
MPFGLKPAPEIFQNQLSTLLENFKNVEVSMDDILIHANDEKELNKITTEVMEVLKISGHKSKPKKSARKSRAPRPKRILPDGMPYVPEVVYKEGSADYLSSDIEKKKIREESEKYETLCQLKKTIQDGWPEDEKFANAKKSILRKSPSDIEKALLAHRNTSKEAKVQNFQVLVD